MNKAGKDKQWLFSGKTGLIYPDFIGKDADQEDKELRFNRGSTFEDNVVARDDVNVLETAPNGTRSHIRRLILVYDYLKWGK